jgi:hypothetical protein
MTDPIEFIRGVLISSSCTRVGLVGEWYFFFQNGANLRVGCLWRIVSGGRVALTGFDHEQLFGLKVPINAADEAAKLLNGKKVESVKVFEGTADLNVEFSEGLRLEVINNSSGYEPWGCDMAGLSLVATAQGEIDVWKPDGQIMKKC